MAFKELGTAPEKVVIEFELLDLLRDEIETEADVIKRVRERGRRRQQEGEDFSVRGVVY